MTLPGARWAPAMDAALCWAVRAAAAGEIPVGAVVVGAAGEILAGAGNARESLSDPTGHAEILALRSAAQQVGQWRLCGTTLVATLEPCVMCAGAAVLARVDRVVYAAADPKAGAAGSVWDLLRDDRHNHRVEVIGGLRAAEAGELLRCFFRARRPAGSGNLKDGGVA